MTTKKKASRCREAAGHILTHYRRPRYNPDRRGNQPLFAFRKATRLAGGGDPKHELEPLEIHELAKLVPEMTAAEYQELRDDIKEKGLREPIILYEGKVLDGRHRDRACRELGLPRTIETYKGTEPAGFIISKNVKHRHLHLTKQEQVRLIAKVLKAASTEVANMARSVKRDAAGRLQGSTKDELKAAVVEHAAEIGISPRTVRRVLAKPKPRKPKQPKQVNKLAPEYVHRRFGMFIKHWNHEQQRTVRKLLRGYLSP